MIVSASPMLAQSIMLGAICEACCRTVVASFVLSHTRSILGGRRARYQNQVGQRMALVVQQSFEKWKHSVEIPSLYASPCPSLPVL